MYLAANGKIYISSGSSVKHLHEMNYPDSAGIACDVQLHNVFTNCFFIGVPNHPNYYLGRLVGSPCDTLTGIHDLAAHDFRFSISPNPNNGNFRIMYLLPQNKSGTLQIFNITGKEIYHQNLPLWSTAKYISLPKIADGVYQCTITSNNQRVNKKLVVVREWMWGCIHENNHLMFSYCHGNKRYLTKKRKPSFGDDFFWFGFGVVCFWLRVNFGDK